MRQRWYCWPWEPTILASKASLVRGEAGIHAGSASATTGGTLIVGDTADQEPSAVRRQRKRSASRRLSSNLKTL